MTNTNDVIKYFDLDLFIQPSESRQYYPISFRWLGSDMEKKVFDNPRTKGEDDVGEFNR